MSKRPARKAGLKSWAAQAIPKLVAMGRDAEAEQLRDEAAAVNLSDRMGEAARTLLRHFQRLHKLPQTGVFNTATVKALAPYTPTVTRSFGIGTTWHAITHGGVRTRGAVKYIVLHDMEFSSLSAAEVLGSLSQSRSYGASPQYGVDNDSIQQYLPLTVIGWHCTSFNNTTVGIEQSGYAANTRETFQSG